MKKNCWCQRLFILIFCLAIAKPLFSLAEDINQPVLKIPELQINLPGLLFSDQNRIQSVTEGQKTFFYIPWIGEYLNWLYNYSVGIIAVLALIAIMVGGFNWLLAGGNASRVTEAKNWISAAFSGLGLALGSYLILVTINSNLVKLPSIKMLAMKRADIEIHIRDNTNPGMSGIKFTQGRGGRRPEAIVLHIMDGTLAGTDAWFQNPSNQASAHYGIGTNGEIHQYVKEEDTAYHAGRIKDPTWRLIKNGVNPNSYTIGIEHEGRADTIWSSEMKQASAALIRQICQRWQIPIDRDHIIGHYQIFSERVNCPSIPANRGIIDEIINLAK